MTRKDINQQITTQLEAAGYYRCGYGMDVAFDGDLSGQTYSMTEARKIAKPGDTLLINVMTRTHAVDMIEIYL